MSIRIPKTSTKLVENEYPLQENIKVLFPGCKKYKEGYIVKSQYGYNFYYMDPRKKCETFTQLSGLEKIMYREEPWLRHSYVSRG